MALIAPAVCDNCGTVFPSGYEFGPGSYDVRGNKSGPCPNCRGMGSIPDGVYNVLDNTLSIVSSWSPERVQHLIDGLEQAQAAADPLAATQEVLAQEEDIGAIANRLLVPTNPAEFWAFVAALLMILDHILKH